MEEIDTIICLKKKNFTIIFLKEYQKNHREVKKGRKS